MPLATICKQEEMPDKTTVYRWLQNYETFRNLYARAREDQADTLADEIIAIADEDPALVFDVQHLSGTEIEVARVDSAAVNHQRLRVDARKWIAAKLKPKKYGEKTEIEHTGDLKIGVVSYAPNHDPA